MPEDTQSGSGKVGAISSNGRYPLSRGGRSRARYKAKYFGAVDLGTNNCRLLIARSLPDGFKVVDSFSSVVRLGAGLARTGKLADANMDAAVAAIQICSEKMKAKNVKRWRCIATQACRQASNGQEFLDRVKEETGLRFDPISAKVEARLAVMGCLNIIDKTKQVALVIDIGGGSTELSWVDVRKLRAQGDNVNINRPPISAWISLPIGVVNLSEMYPEDKNDLSGWYQTMKDHVRAEIVKLNSDKRFTNVFADGKGHLIGTSGTITSLAGVNLKLPYYQRNKVDGIWVNQDEIIQTANRLAHLPFEERSLEPCVGEDRALMIVAGSAIIDVVCELWPSERIRVADRGLREGILMGLMNKSQINRTGKFSPSSR